MNNTANTGVLIAASIALVLGVLIGFIGFSAIEDTDECYTEAIELAGSAVATTEDFGAYTVDSLDRIMAGVPHNQSEMDRIGSDHRSNTEALADIQDRCGEA